MRAIVFAHSKAFPVSAQHLQTKQKRKRCRGGKKAAAKQAIPRYCVGALNLASFPAEIILLGYTLKTSTYQFETYVKF